jgi:superoxide dismutase, Fe-Mn family
MTHSLPALPYGYGALEPYIDEGTMRLHHDKHHQTYVTNLNAALEHHGALQDWTLEYLLRHLDDVAEPVRTAVRNNGGAHFAHSLYWEVLTPGGAGEPRGALADAIHKAFGGFDQFREQFARAGLARFGSGWAWLAVSRDGELACYSLPGADTPHMKGDTPILTMDVWEHAYYLKYQNRRAEYIENFFRVINWDRVGEFYMAATNR